MCQHRRARSGDVVAPVRIAPPVLILLLLIVFEDLVDDRRLAEATEPLDLVVVREAE